jgi:hypothetical protein
MAKVSSPIRVRKGPRASWLFLTLAVATGGVTWSAGCTGDPVPPSRSPRDPANPSAPEAPMNAPAPMTTMSEVPHTHDNAGGMRLAAADAGVVYTCPMHPEVRSNAPGRCPKCGMALVVAKP